MTITRTHKGYALGSWEGVPMQLEDGGRLTPCEMRVAVCAVNGMTHREAAQQMQCSRANINQAWQSIFYKLECNRAIVAINLMIDLGALRRLLALLLMLGAIQACDDGWRNLRTRQGRGSIRTASKRAGGRITGSALMAGLLFQLDQLTGAGDCYTAADVQVFAGEYRA